MNQMLKPHVLNFSSTCNLAPDSVNQALRVLNGGQKIHVCLLIRLEYCYTLVGVGGTLVIVSRSCQTVTVFQFNSALISGCMWKNTAHDEMKWKIWTLFNNWFSVINNLKIFYKESQTQYFTNFALFFFSFICTKEWSDMDLVPRKKELTQNHTHTHRHTQHSHETPFTNQRNYKHFRFQTYQQCFISYIYYIFFKLHISGFRKYSYHSI